MKKIRFTALLLAVLLLPVLPFARAEESPAVVWGDATGDGTVNAADLALLRRFLAELDPIAGPAFPPEPGADADGSGDVNARDLALLRRYLATFNPYTGTSEVVLGPAPEETGSATSEEGTEPVTDPATEPETEPETEPGTDPVTDPETEPQTEPQTEPEAPQGFSITLSFAGDCTLASDLDAYSTKSYDGFKEYAEKNPAGYFLELVKPIFEADDFTVVNLECVLSDSALTPKSKSGVAYWFKGPASNAAILTSGSVEAVSLANNHIKDYNTQGLNDTIAVVKAAGLDYGYESTTLHLEKNGFRIAVICAGLWNSGQTSFILNRLKVESKETDFQIVFFHGGTEGTHTADAWKIQAARDIVDAGADLVIGNHPHVLQPMEEYKGVRILQSLGNFCYGGSVTPENRTMIYQITLDVGADGLLAGTSEKIIPCYVHTGAKYNNFRPAPITNEAEIQKVMDFLNGKVSSPK